MLSLFYRNLHRPWKALAALALIAILCGCRDKGPTDLDVGHKCMQSRECGSGICLFPTQVSKEGRCSRPCTASTDCPEGWSCTAITQNGVMVCQEGPATPFGF
jgi:hypothetical protein